MLLDPMVLLDPVVCYDLLTLQIPSEKCCALGGCYGHAFKTLLTLTSLETDQVHSTSCFELARSTHNHMSSPPNVINSLAVE